MGVIELKLPCPKSVNGIAADPHPDWSFDNLLLELDSIHQKQNATLGFPVPFTKIGPTQLGASRDNSHCGRSFKMHVSDESDNDSEEEANASSMVYGRRFICDEPYMRSHSLSEQRSSTGVHYRDDSDDDCHLMDKVGLAEGALHDLTDEFQLTLSEEVRSKISSLESQLVNENEDFDSSATKIDKHRELQRERERRFDLQYQRTIAEALDNHLIDVQRDHDHISELEERKIRDDAAREEAKRMEKTLQEEKLRQQMIKADEEARQKAERAENAKAAALEAEKKAAEETASKQAAESSAQNVAKEYKETIGSSNSAAGKNLIRASENALKLERQRSQVYGELLAENNAFKASASQDYNRHGQNIGRQIKTITATAENVRTRAEELVKLITSPGFPQSVSIQLFAEKIVSYCTNQKSSVVIFAVSRVIVLVTSKVPQAMDILIAELNRVCIYTVPKHVNYIKEAYENKDAYFRAIGYKEKDGKMESMDDFVERLSCYMKLYGALVQTEVGGFQNLHGVKEGWAWLARFLNTLPANLYTAVALDSFLEMAGFAMHRRYRNQFEKLMGVVARDFLNTLKEGGSDLWGTKLSKVKTSIRNYLESSQFKREPEGLQLRGHLESNDFYVRDEY